MKLSRGARRCLAVLKTFLGGKTHCWPSQKTIARQLKCSKRSVIRYVEELREAKIVTSARENRNTSYTYTLQAELSPRLSPRIVTSNEIYPNMNLKPSEQERRPVMRETRRDAARRSALSRATPIGGNRAYERLSAAEQDEVEAFAREHQRRQERTA